MEPSLRLGGAVNDALAMREWLLDTSGGNVPNQNLFLLLSHDNRPGIPPSRKATVQNIGDAILEVTSRYNDNGERLYFYFSGHGLSTIYDYSIVPAICPADFDRRFPSRTTISINSITNYFKAHQFQEQFFFFDACRDMPYNTSFRVGHFEAPNLRRFPNIQQTIMYATSPGQQAIELLMPGNESGAFTDALIRGLNGEGKSKIYDVGQDRYLVKAERLLEFVRDEVEKKFQTEDEKKIHRPRIDGERDSSSVISSFSSSEFSSVDLSVLVNPPEVSPIEVSIRGGDNIPSIKSTTIPVKFTLPQDDYGVIVRSVDHTQKQKPWPVKLYSPQQITVDMIKDPFNPSGGMSFPDEPPPDAFSAVLTTQSLKENGTIRVSSSDGLAPIQIADHVGNIVSNGLGYAFYTGTPGLYRIRLMSPDEKYEKIVELKPNKTEDVSIESPNVPDISPELIRKTGFQIEKDNSLRVSEYVGSILEPKLTTILALASRSSDKGWNSYKLGHLGFAGFSKLTHNATSGLSLVIGSEYGFFQHPHNVILDVKIRFWLQKESIPEKIFLITPLIVEGFAEFAIKAAPGSYWLSIESENKTEPLILSVAILPDRITLITLVQNNDGSKSIFQYMPSVLENNIQNDVLSLRKINFMQQFYTRNALDYLRPEEIIELAYMKWEDPMAGCLAGYLLLKNFAKSRYKDSILEIGKNMSKHFANIPDSFVLDGKIKEITRSDDAVESYKTALESGIPLFSDGLSILYYAIKEHKVLNDTVFAPIVKFAFEIHSLGTPWSCFRSPLKPNVRLGSHNTYFG